MSDTITGATDGQIADPTLDEAAPKRKAPRKRAPSKRVKAADRPVETPSELVAEAVPETPPSLDESQVGDLPAAEPQQLAMPELTETHPALVIDATDVSAEAESLDLTSAPLHVASAGFVAPLPSDPEDTDAVVREDAGIVVVPPVSEAEALPLFSSLGLSEPIQRAIEEMGYRHPTPIQAQAIPYVLMGRDVLGVAQTGTGKTASFTLPLLDILSGSRARARMPRSLILEPTRELALQVAENFVMYGKYTKLTHALLIGGESMQDQKAALNAGVDVLIATPGRLLDLFERGGLLMTQTKILVIDEADRMLDMGFIPDVERIVTLLSPNRQTLFFSATMAPEIRRLSDAFLQNPKEITVSRPSTVAALIVAGLAIVEDVDKRKALRKLIRAENVSNALIFCNRKRDVDILYKSLVKHGFSAGALHGDLPQSVRTSTLEKFKLGEIKLLVCSDVAARGIDIGGLSHVFNFDVPIHAEDYVHRTGRTGRAGRSGHAYTLATPHDRGFVAAIEKLTGQAIPPLEVEGINTAAWSEDDGGRRGGRGGRGRTPEKRSETRPENRQENRQDNRQPEKRAEEQPKPASEVKDHRREPERARPPEADRPVERQPARQPQPQAAEGRNDRRPQNERPSGDRRPDRVQDAKPQDTRRDQRHRPDDLGPAMIGFGDEIPAFMLLPTRARRTDPVDMEQDYADTALGRD
ncbi:MAG: DEAD/DEAH box helicase [Janthinobacterium lividum]